MTLPRYRAIAERWNTFPPLSVTLAGIASVLGLKLGAERAPNRLSETMGFEEFVAGFGGGITKVERTPEWLRDQ